MHTQLIHKWKMGFCKYTRTPIQMWRVFIYILVNSTYTHISIVMAKTYTSIHQILHLKISIVSHPLPPLIISNNLFNLKFFIKSRIVWFQAKCFIIIFFYYLHLIIVNELVQCIISSLYVCIHSEREREHKWGLCVEKLKIQSKIISSSFAPFSLVFLSE